MLLHKLDKPRERNIICVPLAFREGANTGVNISGDVFNTYLKNACVALVSAKHYNPDSEVWLVTNISIKNIPDEYIRVLSRRKIVVTEVPYDSFCFPDNYEWSLAFYKLCVLNYLSNQDFNNVCYIDADVYVQGALTPIWEECKDNILLYDINHGLHVRDYRMICEEFKAFCGHDNYPAHYGGEFFAASLSLTKEFCSRCLTIYEQILVTGFRTSKGDEFVISLAALGMKKHIKNAAAYIFRFWTGRFRLVSTCYEFNRVILLHMPDEKNRGILSLYSSYIKYGKIPRDKQVWKACRLSHIPLFDSIRFNLIVRIFSKCFTK